MTRFRLPHGAVNLDMDDGTRYKIRGHQLRGGVIEVDNPAHARAIKAMGAVEGTVHTVDFTAPPGRAGRRCRPCDFAAYPWQRDCPRCGAPTDEESPL